MNQKANVDHHDIAWWNDNISGMDPRDMKGSQSVFFFELRAAGLDSEQAHVVNRERILGLHRITSSRDLPPVAPEVFARVVGLLVQPAQ